MRRVLSSFSLTVVAFAFVFALVAMDAGAEPQGGKNTKEAIEKCDKEQTDCRSKCDNTIIDIDDNVDRCKKACDADRGLCLQYLVGGPAAGARSPAPTTLSPGGASTTPPALVCCYNRRRGGRHELHTGSCPFSSEPGWFKVHISRCQVSSPQTRPPGAPLAHPEPPKYCCRYAGPAPTQPIYKWDPAETCRNNKGTRASASACIAVFR